MYLQKVISKKKLLKILVFCWRLEGQWQNLQDLDPDPDPWVERHGSSVPNPYQNFMDLQHWLQGSASQIFVVYRVLYLCHVMYRILDLCVTHLPRFWIKKWKFPLYIWACLILVGVTVCDGIFQIPFISQRASCFRNILHSRSWATCRDPVNNQQVKTCIVSLSIYKCAGSGIRCFLTPGPGYGMVKYLGPGMNIADHFS